MGYTRKIVAEQDEMRTEDELEKYRRPIVDVKETILAEGVSLGTDMFETKLNNNVIVFGTPGGGKTEGLVKPNIMQMNSSYVVTDPKGNLHRELGGMLKKAGYSVQCLNLLDPENSVGYNPFVYADGEEGDEFIVDEIIETTGKNRHDPYWDDATALLLKALIAYLREMARIYDDESLVTMRQVISLLDCYGDPPKGEWEKVDNRLMELFMELAEGKRWIDGEETRWSKPHRDCLAVKLWWRFIQVTPASTTFSCIMMEVWGKLSHLASSGVLDILDGENQVDFATLGRSRTALFVVVPDTDRSLDAVTCIFYTQLFKELCREADLCCADNDNRLHVPVRVILDDFANQNVIPDFDVLIAAVRSRDIWIMPVCQATAQLEDRYGPAAQTIIGCCDTTVYLGVNDMETARELSERADLPISDIQKLPVGEALIFMRGHEAMRAQRFDIANHPNFRFTARYRNGLGRRGRPNETDAPSSSHLHTHDGR